MKKITKKKLINYYIKNHLSINAIAKLYNVSYTKIRNMIIKYNIPRRTISEANKGKYNGMYNIHRFAKLAANYKDGRYSKTYYCKVRGCNNRISYCNWLYGKRKCSICYYKTLKVIENNTMFGKKHTKESKIKMSLSAGGTGIPHEFDTYPADFLQIRDKILERDKYICQLCNVKQEVYGHKLDVHHIDYNKENNNSNNLISLCHKCNIKVNKNREKWRSYFQNKGGING